MQKNCIVFAHNMLSLVYTIWHLYIEIGSSNYSRFKVFHRNLKQTFPENVNKNKKQHLCCNHVVTIACRWYIKASSLEQLCCSNILEDRFCYNWAVVKAGRKKISTMSFKENSCLRNVCKNNQIILWHGRDILDVDFSSNDLENYEKVGLTWLQTDSWVKPP